MRPPLPAPPEPEDLTEDLDPFSLPSGAALRFALLIAAVGASAAFIYQFTFFSIASNRQRFLETYLRCSSEAAAAHPLDPFAQSTQRQACAVGADHRQVLWILTGLVLLTTTTWVVYRVFPRWKRHRSRLQPIPTDDAAEIVQTLRDLSGDPARLKEAPRFLWDPTERAVRAFSFGRRGAAELAISGGLVTLHYTDPGRFRAIVLHELAHVRNGDVGKAYAAVAVWRAFIVVALLPLAAALVDEDVGLIWKVGWRVVVLSAFVLLTRNAYLRARELDADARVATWDGRERIRAVLRDLGDNGGPRWKQLLRLHPTPSERRAGLAQPARLFRASSWDAVATGIAVALALPVVERFISLVARDTPETYLVAALAVAPLAAGVVGLILWRGSVASLPWYRSSPRLAIRLGLYLGIGFSLGKWLSLDSAIQPTPSAEIWKPAYVLVELLSPLVVTVGLIALLSMLAAAVTVWLPVAIARRPFRAPVAISLVVLGVGLAAWLGATLAAQEFAETLVSSGDLGTATPTLWGAGWGLILIATASWRTLGILSALWLFPMSVWAWRRWSKPSPSATRFRAVDVSPGIAAVYGSVAAGIFLVGQLVVRAVIHARVAPAVRGSVGYRVAFQDRSTLVAVSVAVVVAVVVALRVRAVPQAHGMMAATVGGATMALVIPAASAFASCVPAFSLLSEGLGCHWVATTYVLRTLALIVNGALLLCLPILAVGAVVIPPRGDLATLPDRVDEPSPVGRRGPRWAESGAILAAMVVSALVIVQLVRPEPIVGWSVEANRICLGATADIKGALAAGDGRRALETLSVMVNDLRAVPRDTADPDAVEAMIGSYEQAIRLVAEANVARAGGDPASGDRLAAGAVAAFEEASALALQQGAESCQI